MESVYENSMATIDVIFLLLYGGVFATIDGIAQINPTPGS